MRCGELLMKRGWSRRDVDAKQLHAVQDLARYFMVVEDMDRLGLPVTYDHPPAEAVAA